VLNISVKLKDCLFIMFKNEKNYKCFHIIIISNDNLNKVISYKNHDINLFARKIILGY